MRLPWTCSSSQLAKVVRCLDNQPALPRPPLDRVWSLQRPCGPNPNSFAEKRSNARGDHRQHFGRNGRVSSHDACLRISERNQTMLLRGTKLSFGVQGFKGPRQVSPGFGRLDHIIDKPPTS